MEAVPLHLKQANEFVRKHHARSLSCIGCKFAIGCMVDDKFVGVAIAGRRVARRLDDGKMLEVLRVCTDGTPNACSFLNARVARIAWMMGYAKVVTFSLASGSGSSLKAVGAKVAGEVKPQEWAVRAQLPKQWVLHVLPTSSGGPVLCPPC
jgi:hypothetical protein